MAKKTTWCRSVDAQLIAAAKAGDKSAMRKLIERHYGLIFSVTHRTVGQDKIDDYLAVAVIGFHKAVERFDASLGFSITTYASKAMFQHLCRAKLESGIIRIPESAHNQPPADVRESLDRLRRRPTPFSVLEEFDLEPSRDLGDSWEKICARDELQRIREYLDRLTEYLTSREADILWQVARGQTYRSIAQQYGIGRERIRQIRAGALEKLRRHAASLKGAHPSGASE